MADPIRIAHGRDRDFLSRRWGMNKAFMAEIECDGRRAFPGLGEEEQVAGAQTAARANVSTTPKADTRMSEPERADRDRARAIPGSIETAEAGGDFVRLARNDCVASADIFLEQTRREIGQQIKIARAAVGFVDF